MVTLKENSLDLITNYYSHDFINTHLNTKF